MGRLTELKEKNVYSRTAPQITTTNTNTGNFFLSDTGKGSLFKKKKKEDSGLKTLGSTLADIGLEAGEGAVGVIENLIAKPLLRGAANVIKTSGIAKLHPEYNKLRSLGVDIDNIINDELDKALDRDYSKIAFGKDKETQEYLKSGIEKYGQYMPSLAKNISFINADTREGIEESSVLGEGGKAIAQGLGQSLTIGGVASGLTAGTTGALANAGVNVTKGLTKAVEGASTFATSGISSFNGKLTEMHNQGYDDRTSLIVAGKTGLFEGLTELIGAGIPGLNTSGAFDVIENKLGSALTKQFNSNVGRLAVGVLKAGEEASEEFFNNFFNTASDYLLYKIDKNYTYDKENKTGNIIEDLKNEKTLEQMLYAGITAGLTGGSVNMASKVSKNSVIKAYAKDNNIDFNTAKKQIEEYTSIYADKLEQQEEKPNYMEVQENAENSILNSARSGALANTENAIGNLVNTYANEYVNKEELKKEIRKELAKGNQDTNGIIKIIEKANQEQNKANETINKQEIKNIPQEDKTTQEKLKNVVKTNIKTTEEITPNNIEEEQTKLKEATDKKIADITSDYNARIEEIEKNNTLPFESEETTKLKEEMQSKIKEVKDEYEVENKKLQDLDKANIKYGDIVNKTTYEDVKKEYTKAIKQINDGNYDSKEIERYESLVPANKQGRRTKQEWLSIANMLGSNSKAKTSEELQQEAVASFLYARPNQKENLNRQGKKYEKFTIEDWLKEYHKGAKVGTRLSEIKENKPKQENKTTETKTTQEKAKNDVKEPKILNESKKDDVLEVTPEQRKEHAKLFKTTGDDKIRKFVNSAVESDAVDGLLDMGDLDTNKITYVPISNKKTLANANNKLDILGYEEALKYISGRFNDDTATLDDIALAERLIQESAKRKDSQVTSDLIISTAILGTELGQKVQALSMIRRLTPEGQLKALNRVITKNKASNNNNVRETWKDVELTDEMIKEILGAYDKQGNYNQDDLNQRVENVKQEIRDKLKVSVFDKMNSWRYLAMLGNPKTHIRNVVSNVAMRMTIKVKNAMARTLEDVLPIQNKTKTWKRSTQFIKDFAKKTTQEMKAEITGEGKFDETTDIERKKKIFKFKIMNNALDFNSNLLEGEDWFFSSRAFEDTLREYLTANGINTQEDIDNNPEIVQKGINYSVEQAQIATFRQYSKLASIINNAEKKSKVAKVIIESVLPFKKTPINVAKAGISYSPLGLVKSLSYDIYRVKTGQIEASQLIDNISQGVTGTALALIGYALAKAGILKASGGDDKEEQYDEALGNSAYSIKIGDKNYSLSWLSPVAMPLFVGAEAHRVLEEKEEWNMNIVADSLAETLDPLNEMSFMQGITSALDGYAKGTGHLGDMAKNSAQSYILQFFPTLFSQFASLMDDKKRSTRADKTADWVFGDETIRKIMYKIPGLRNQLEVATDIWGNEKEQSDNILERAFDIFINPASTNKDISSKLDDELKRVYEATDESGVIPSVPYGYVNANGEKITMTAEEYTKYKKEYGQTAYKYLNQITNSSQYKALTDTEKANVIKEVFAYSKAKSNKDILDIEMNNKYTKANIIADYPIYKMYQSHISTIEEKYKNLSANASSKEKTNISKSKKEEITKYINSLPLNSQKKLILYRLAGGYSIKDNKAYIYDYINKQNMTQQEKSNLWKTLFE